MTNQYMQYAPDTQLIANLTKAINGEYSAIHCYEKLAGQTNNSNIKKQIEEIRQDEMRHYQTFSYIYQAITGKQPTPKRTEKCPAQFLSGLHAAFLDEQKTVDFYHEVARNTVDPVIRDAFTQAAADEQNHAVWFLYFIQQGK